MKLILSLTLLMFFLFYYYLFYHNLCAIRDLKLYWLIIDLRQSTVKKSYSFNNIF